MNVIAAMFNAISCPASDAVPIQPMKSAVTPKAKLSKNHCTPIGMPMRSIRLNGAQCSVSGRHGRIAGRSSGHANASSTNAMIQVEMAVA